MGVVYLKAHYRYNLPNKKIFVQITFRKIHYKQNKIIDLIQLFNTLKMIHHKLTRFKWNTEKFLCTVSYMKYAYGINFIFVLELDRDEIRYRICLVSGENGMECTVSA